MREALTWSIEMSDNPRKQYQGLLQQNRADPLRYQAIQEALQRLDHAAPSHRLTAHERVALVRNLRLILGKSIPDLKDENTRKRAIRALNRQVNLPRFRFLNQIPQARLGLLTALRGTGVRFEGVEQETAVMQRSWL